MEGKVTITDVAKLAGVSRATAGRVIGNYGNVSEETKESVRAAAQELNYFPNAMAQGLRSKKTNTIAIIVDRISNKFFSNVIATIEREAFRKGYSVIICNTHEDINIELRQMKALQNKRVDAIIIAPAFSPEPLVQRKDLSLYCSDIPTVFIDRPLEGMQDSENLITSDNYGGSYRATEYLLELGHQNIAVMTTRNFPTEILRVKGYKAALKDHNIPFRPDSLFVPEKGDRTQGNLLIKEMFMLHSNFTALIIMNIDFLPSVLFGLRELGKRIPEDLTLIVWDESELTDYLELTTVVQFPEFMGKVAINRAIELIEETETENELKMVPTELHVRASCKTRAEQ